METASVFAVPVAPDPVAEEVVVAAVAWPNPRTRPPVAAGFLIAATRTLAEALVEATGTC